MTRAQVLIIEDEALVARDVQDKLLELGYGVPAVVDTGRAAVEKARELRPDLVLMDIHLRGEMDGIEAAAQIRDLLDIPVVYLTAYSDEETLQRAKVTDPFGYIVKPFRASELHSLVEMALYRHTMEQKLKESEARFRSVVEDQTEWIVRWLPDGTRTFVNQSYCTTFGVSPAEALGSSLFSSIPATDRASLRTQIEAVTPDNPSWLDERRVLLPDGTMAWTLWTHRGLFDRRGHLLEFQSVGRDITERVRAEAALREAKEAADEARQQEERRRQEAERRRQIAESLGHVLAALNTDQSLDEVLDFIAAQTRELLGTAAVAVFGLDANAGDCTIQAAVGLPAELLTGAESLPGLGGLRQAMASGQPVAITDLTAADPARVLGERTARAADAGVLSSQTRERGDSSGSGLYRAMLAVPIRVKDEIYGAMCLYYTQPRVFSDEDVELATLFSTQVALAVENARLRREAEESAVAAERNRLARELHDAVTQSLFSASLIAEVLPGVWERYPEDGRRGLEELRRLTQGALAEMRTLLLELRPAGLTEQPLGQLIRRLAEAMEARTRIEVSVQVADECFLPSDVHVALYRITQEALNNISKHARASRATVSLQCEPSPGTPRADAEILPPSGATQVPLGVTLRIADDGRGFDPAATAPHHLGVGIMRERARAIGAHLVIKSQPGLGTEMTVIWRGPGEPTGEREDGDE